MIAGTPVSSELLVPAPIKLLISAAVTPLANVGLPPPLNIPGSAYIVGLLLRSLYEPLKLLVPYLPSRFTVKSLSPDLPTVSTPVPVLNAKLSA